MFEFASMLWNIGIHVLLPYNIVNFMWKVRPVDRALPEEGVQPGQQPSVVLMFWKCLSRALLCKTCQRFPETFNHTRKTLSPYEMCKAFHPPGNGRWPPCVCQEEAYWFKMPSVYPGKPLTRPYKYDWVQNPYALFQFM
jgi:hypothetical protein